MKSGETFVSKLLNVQSIGTNLFKCERTFTPNTVTIYGGELMSQALMAAAKTVQEGYRPNSIHCDFHSQCDVKKPNAYRVTKLRDGKSFCHRLIEAIKINDDSVADEEAPYFRMQCSFKTPEEDQASFVAPMPTVPAPESVLDFTEYAKGLTSESLSDITKTRLKGMKYFLANAPIIMKFCEPEYIFGLKQNQTGKLHTWVQLKEPPSGPFNMYRDALFAYVSDALLLWSGMTEPLQISYLVTLNQSIWFHNHDVCPEPDQWILCETQVRYVGGALSLSHGSIWDKRGHLLANMVQQGLIRTQSIKHNASIASFDNLQNQK